MSTYIGIEERPPLARSIPLSFQHLFAMFGATILVPLLLGVDPAIALLMNGIGTLLYTAVTKGKIPAYLGSSFAFIAPASLVIQRYGGFAHAQSGFLLFGLFFVAVSFVIRAAGIRWISIVMPPPVMGAVVAVIGLELAPVAAGMSGLVVTPAAPMNTNIVLVSMFTLLVGIVGSVVFRGFMKIIPILTAVVAGYAFALVRGMVDFSLVANAPWLKLPAFSAPIIDTNAMIIIAPACLVVLAEHIGHLIVTGNVTERDLMKDPGLHLSLLGDGLSNLLSGLAGSPPNTTYGENIGVMAITRVYSVWVIRGAAVIAVLLSGIGKVAAAIQSIPTPVMGGISLLLYGVIASSGIRMLVDHRVDFSKSTNMVLAAVTFVIGVSGAAVTIGAVELKGMALAAVSGVALSLLFYGLHRLGLMNDAYDLPA